MKNEKKSLGLVLKLVMVAVSLVVLTAFILVLKSARMPRLR